MLDGLPLIDAHLHPARLPTLRPAWMDWAVRYGQPGWQDVYDGEGAVVPAAFDALLAAEGADRAILLCEYSPKVTGIQAIEDNLALVAHNPRRFRTFAAINPHYHFPIRAELARQLGLGAVALKVHPVHAGCAPDDAALWPAYALCEERGIPVVIHCGTSTFPGADNRFADPAPVDRLSHHFPGVQWLLAHGGRGWWYDAAAFIVTSRPNVWLELSGLPPQRLATYYCRFDLPRLLEKAVFGTDWPGAPGFRRNVEGIAGLGLTRSTLEGVMWRNANTIYRLGL